MNKELRNISGMELATDLYTKDGRRVFLKEGASIEIDKLDEKSYLLSKQSGRLKTYLEKKYIIEGEMIKGDARKMEIIENKEIEKQENEKKNKEVKKHKEEKLDKEEKLEKSE